MVRILFYESRPEWGGAQKCELELLTSLENKEIETFFVTSTDGPMNSRAIALGKTPTIIPIHKRVNQVRKGELKSGWFYILQQGVRMIPHLIRVIHFILKHRVNIVYTSQFRSQLVIGWPAKILGRKVIWHIHGEEQLQNFLGKLAVRAADTIIVVSHSLAENYRAQFPQKTFKVVHNGVEIPPSTNEKTARPFTISMVASLIEGKRQDLAISAVTKLKKSGYHVQLHLIGEKPSWHRDDYKNKLQATATDDVIFHGWVENPIELVSQSDVLILPSDTEGMPLTIIEAMSAGVPAIATNVGGVPELIVDGKTGFLIPPGSDKALIEKLTYFLENRQECKRMGEQARTRYQSFFTKERFIKGVEGVIYTATL
nr:glycosyltransferase family 4 protein [Neobacillus sp. Marseille-Q6967]